MTRPASPSPPPPTASPPPPRPRRSCTCDGSSLCPGRNLIGGSYLEVARRKRGNRRGEDEHEKNRRPDEQRRAGSVRATERAELQHELREAGRVDGQAMKCV